MFKLQPSISSSNCILRVKFVFSELFWRHWRICVEQRGYECPIVEQNIDRVLSGAECKAHYLYLPIAADNLGVIGWYIDIQSLRDVEINLRNSAIFSFGYFDLGWLLDVLWSCNDIGEGCFSCYWESWLGEVVFFWEWDFEGGCDWADDCT